MSEVTGVGILRVFFNKECKRNNLGPEFLVGSHRMSENSGVGTHRFNCSNRENIYTHKHNKYIIMNGKLT